MPPQPPVPVGRCPCFGAIIFEHKRDAQTPAQHCAREIVHGHTLIDECVWILLRERFRGSIEYIVKTVTIELGWKSQVINPRYGQPACADKIGGNGLATCIIDGMPVFDQPLNDTLRVTDRAPNCG